MIRENATTTAETGKEKDAPVSIDGAGAMAPPWADTLTSIERTRTTKMEMQTCAIMNVKKRKESETLWKK